jgi:hypothetical protein
MMDVDAYNTLRTRTIPDMTASIALLAHQGGWDEILLVTVPIVAIVAVLAVAKRRVDKMQPDQPDEP